ncbi:hypothetical protein EV363DRAFT_1189323 [Boletus edulis]|nr:hypothetical protein EV363DRAFT_1189323 [Boletus edulis]
MYVVFSCRHYHHALSLTISFCHCNRLPAFSLQSPMPSPRLALGFEAIHPATQMILSLPTLSSRAIYMSDIASTTWAVDGFLDREAMDLHLKGQLDRTMSTNDFAEIVKGIGRPLRAC